MIFLVWELDPTGVEQESQEQENPDVVFWYGSLSRQFFFVMYITQLFAAC